MFWGVGGHDLMDLLAEGMIPKRDFWQIAFDGSGPVTANETHYAYAGVMGARGAWGAFTERWEPVLNRFDVPYLRMTEAMNFGGVFRAKADEWGTERVTKRDELLWELVRIMLALDLRPVGIALQAGGLAEKQAALRQREVFQLVITQILRDHRERHFTLTCDIEQDAADHYRAWLANLQQRDPDARRVFGMCFMDDKVFAPIQVADFVAFLLREDAERDCHRPTDPVSPFTLALRRDGPAPIAGQMLNGEPL